jgi:hypothetical protein
MHLAMIAKKKERNGRRRTKEGREKVKRERRG